MSQSDVTEYNKEIEDLFLQFMLSKPELFVRCKGILNSKYFDDEKNQKTVEFLEKHSNEYSSLPTLKQIKAIAGKTIEPLDNVTEKHEDWFLKEFELFCRHKAVEIEVLKSVDLLREKRHGEVLNNVKKAVEIGLVKDLGTDYFDNPKERLTRLLERETMVPTGWKAIDHKLYGGTERGTLTIFAGQSGSGKSLFLQNWGINLATQGLNVVYITLELSEKLSALRLDAMITGYGTKEVLRNLDDVDLRVLSHKRKHKGSLQVKQLPNGCTANDVRAYIKEYEIQTNRKVDAVLVDYLDLLMPMSRRVSPSDLYVKDKYVSEELRNLSIDLDVVMGSASQLNRQSHEEIEFDHSHISGGISKINTADNVIAIFTTATMRENGRYQLQFMKTRSSAGVGHKVDLKFDVKSLRIVDLEPGEEKSNTVATNDIVNKLKERGSISKPEPKNEKQEEDVLKQGNRLRDLIRKSE